MLHACLVRLIGHHSIQVSLICRINTNNLSCSARSRGDNRSAVVSEQDSSIPLSPQILYGASGRANVSVVEPTKVNVKYRGKRRGFSAML